jgi:uncharacterized Tic20 family protein
MVAHLSVLVNLFTGFLGPLVALIIYLVFRERSRYVAYQSMQSFVFQIVAWVGGGALAIILWTVGGILSAICIYAGIETNQGKDFRYWLVGDWVRGILTETKP